MFKILFWWCNPLHLPWRIMFEVPIHTSLVLKQNEREPKSRSDVSITEVRYFHKEGTVVAASETWMFHCLQGYTVF